MEDVGHFEMYLCGSGKGEVGGVDDERVEGWQSMDDNVIG